MTDLPQERPKVNEKNVVRDENGKILRYVATEDNPNPVNDIKMKRALFELSQQEKIEKIANMPDDKVNQHKANPKAFLLCTDKKYPLNGFLRDNLDEVAVFLKKKYDCVVIVSGGGKVRVGKTVSDDTTVKILDEYGNIINSKPLGEYMDGEILNTISWDFKNDTQVFSKSEVIKEKDKKIFYKVKLSDGRIIKCSEDHRLFVRRNVAGMDDKKTWKIIELPLRDIKKGDKLICQ